MGNLELETSERNKQIIRAKSWDDLFTSPEAEYQDFIESMILPPLQEFHQNQTLLSLYSTTTADGQLYEFKRTTPGLSYTVIKQYSDGNVLRKYLYPDKPEELSIVTFYVGNIAHPYTYDSIKLPSLETVLKIQKNPEFDWEIRRKIGTELRIMNLYLIGKPATEGWEKNILNSGNFPQRIGHRLYPDFFLNAQAKLREYFPEVLEG